MFYTRITSLQIIHTSSVLVWNPQSFQTINRQKHQEYRGLYYAILLTLFFIVQCVFFSHHKSQDSIEVWYRTLITSPMNYFHIWEMLVFHEKYLVASFTETSYSFVVLIGWIVTSLCLLGLSQRHRPLDHLPAAPLPQDGVVADLLSSAQAGHLVVALALQGKYYTGVPRARLNNK